MTFGQRLARLREDRGLTQPVAAKLAGLSKGGYADLEQGRWKPSWETVLALCEALGVPCTAFTDDTGATGPDAPPRGRGRPRKTPAAVQPRVDKEV